jgi:hypothetical protein
MHSFYGLRSVCLFACLFSVLHPAQEFFIDIETSPLPVKVARFMCFAQGGIITVPHLLWHGASVFLVSLEGHSPQFGRLKRHTRGCGGSILTRILTGYLRY